MRLRRKLAGLNDAIAALDEVYRKAKNDRFIAFSKLSATERAFIQEEIAACVTSRIYYLENYHTIVTETGEIKGMYPLYELQWIIEEAVQKERDLTGQCRVIVLKPRQSGGTEYATGVMCHCTFFTPQAFTLVVAQDTTTASWVQRKITTSWFHLPWWLQPERKFQTKGEYLEFQRKDDIERHQSPGLGSVLVTTHAERGSGVAIGKTVRFLHGTEVSRWNSGEIWTADIEPSMNAPDTLAIFESASLDDRGFFKSLYEGAVEDPESGWVPVFLPAYRAKKFFLPLKKNQVFTLSESEQAARDRVLREENFFIPDVFFNWRRLKIKSSIRDTGAAYAAYAAYPMTAKEAFQSSGSNVVFPRDMLDLQEQNFSPVILAGEIVYQGANMPLKRSLLQNILPGQTLPRREAVGTLRLHVWEEPIQGAIYYIGADTALGREQGDYSACTVWKVGRGSSPDIQVAEWHGKIHPTEWGKVLYALGMWYGKAEIAVEYQGDGRKTGDVLNETLSYPNLYRPRKHDRVAGVALYSYLHFQTNTQTKPKMTAQMVEGLLEGSVKINSQVMIDEMRKFGVTSMPSSTYTAYGGLDGHDDSIMAGLIGLFCLREVMPEFREQASSQQQTQTRSANAALGGVIFGIFDPWTRMRGQTRDISVAEDLCRQNPGWVIKPIRVGKYNTAYSVIHHGRGVENEMYRGGIDSKDILPAAIFAWKGARAAESEDVNEINAWAEGGEQGGWSEQE